MGAVITGNTAVITGNTAVITIHCNYTCQSGRVPTAWQNATGCMGGNQRTGRQTARLHRSAGIELDKIAHVEL
jgi:hypothetical protein